MYQEEIDNYNYAQQVNNARTTPDDEYAGALREERVRTLLTEIDPKNMVESIIQGLRGYRFDKVEMLWKKRKDAVIISENFIAKVEYILDEELSLNTTFSNLQPSDVNNIMALLIDVLVSDVTVHGQSYHVIVNDKTYNLAQDHNLKELVLFGIFSSVYKSLRRAINGTEAKRFFGSLRMNETIAPPQQRKGGVVDAIKTLMGS